MSTTIENETSINNNNNDNINNNNDDNNNKIYNKFVRNSVNVLKEYKKSRNNQENISLPLLINNSQNNKRNNSILSSMNGMPIFNKIFNQKKYIVPEIKKFHNNIMKTNIKRISMVTMTLPNIDNNNNKTIENENKTIDNENKTIENENKTIENNDKTIDNNDKTIDNNDNEKYFNGEKTLKEYLIKLEENKKFEKEYHNKYISEDVKLILQNEYKTAKNNLKKNKNKNIIIKNNNKKIPERIVLQKLEDLKSLSKGNPLLEINQFGSTPMIIKDEKLMFNVLKNNFKGNKNDNFNIDF